MIDLYCERISDGLLAEPINLFTNLAFIITAFYSYRIAEKRSVLNPQIIMLIALIFLIGTGSSLFHMFARPWAQIADVLPILLFQLFYLWIYLRKIVRLNVVSITLLLLVFIVLSAWLGSFEGVLNNSLSYAAGLIYLFGFAIYHKYAGKIGGGLLLGAFVVFLISLTFRTLDPVLCRQISVGTHFLWHLLNGLMLYLLMKTLIINWK